MKLLYESNNGWGIRKQKDLFNNSDSFVIYRFYPVEGWMPYKFVGNSLSLCFTWLWRSNFISFDEMTYQIDLIKEDN